MKKILIAIATLVLLSACASPEQEAKARISLLQAERADKAAAIDQQYAEAKAVVQATELAKIELTKKQATTDIEIQKAIAAARYSAQVLLNDLETKHKQDLDKAEREHQAALAEIQAKTEQAKADADLARANGFRDVLIAGALGISGSLVVLFGGRSASHAFGVWSSNRARRMELKPGEILVDKDTILMPTTGGYMLLRRGGFFSGLIRVMNARAALKAGQPIDPDAGVQIEIGKPDPAAHLIDKQAQVMLDTVREEQRTQRIASVLGRQDIGRADTTAAVSNAAKAGDLFAKPIEQPLIEASDDDGIYQALLEVTNR